GVPREKPERYNRDRLILLRRQSSRGNRLRAGGEKDSTEKPQAPTSRGRKLCQRMLALAVEFAKFPAPLLPPPWPACGESAPEARFAQIQHPRLQCDCRSQAPARALRGDSHGVRDRKGTRLNSSHG